MSTREAHQALVIDRDAVVYQYTAGPPSQAWAGLVEYAYYCADDDTARALQRRWDSGFNTIHLTRHFNGREMTYQVRIVIVDARGNLVDVDL